MYQNVSGPILKFWKNFVLAPAALGTKCETRHTSLFRQKFGSLNRFSRPLIIIFSTKRFSNNNNCSSILMHSTQSSIKNWRDLGLRACAVWPHARQSVVDRRVRSVRQCKKSAKNGCSVTITLYRIYSVSITKSQVVKSVWGNDQRLLWEEYRTHKLATLCRKVQIPQGSTAWHKKCRAVQRNKCSHTLRHLLFCRNV